MMTSFPVKLHDAARHIFTPGGLLLRAVFMVAAFGVLHAFGLRDTMAVLCGTDSSAGQAPQTTFMLAVLYLLGYLGATVVAPIFCLAALFLRLADRFAPANPGAPPA